MQTNNLTMFFIMYIGELNTETRMRDDKERYYVMSNFSGTCLNGHLYRKATSL